MRSDELVQLNTRVTLSTSRQVNAYAKFRGKTIGALIEEWLWLDLARLTPRGAAPRQDDSGAMQMRPGVLTNGDAESIQQVEAQNEV